jgi:hypothetical protein
VPFDHPVDPLGRTAASVALAAFAALSLSVAASRPWARPGPLLHLPSCRAVDLGSGSPGDVRAREVTVANAGAEPLELMVKSGCGCLNVAPARLTIPPRGESAVTLSIRLSRRGTTETGLVHFEPVDSRSPGGWLQALARCPAGIELQPATLDFGPLQTGSPSDDRIVTVAGSLAPLDDFIIDTSQAPGVEVRRSAADPNRTLSVRVRAGAETGRRTVPVVFRRPADESLTTVLTVHYDVFEPISAAPARIAVDASGRPVQLLVWRTDGAPLGRLVRWAPEGAIRVTDETPEPGATRRRLVVTAPQPLGGDGVALREVALHFAGSAEPLKLPVEIAARSDAGP